MARRTQRAALALTGALVALGPVASAVASAPSGATPTAVSAGACTDNTAITVVVDMSAFGDGVLVRCAPQPVRSGFEALTRAGFTYQGTTQFPGLLCRIDGVPASDPCHGAPPANAYWAYWHAPRGGSWTYSTSGAGSRVPPPGSVEGWAFGDDAEPGVDPPAPPPTTSTTRATTATTSPSRSAGDTPPSAGGATELGGATTSTTDAGAPTSTTVAGGSTTTREAAAGAPDPAGGGGGSEQVASAPGSSGGGGGAGSPAGLVVGVVVAVALTAMGLANARRRRSMEDPA